MEQQNFEHMLNQAFQGRRKRESREAAEQALRLQRQREEAARRQQQRSQQDARWAEVPRYAATIKSRAEKTASFLVAQGIEPTFHVPKHLLPLSQRLGLRPRMAGWVALKLSGTEDDNPPRPSGVNGVHYAEMCSSNPGQRFYSYPKIFLSTRGSLVVVEGGGYTTGIHEATTRELIRPYISDPAAAVPAWDGRFAKLVEGSDPASVDEDVWLTASRQW